jgi:hypothetical protein
MSLSFISIRSTLIIYIYICLTFLLLTENEIPLEACKNQHQTMDIDVFKRKANRVPLSPLSQGINFSINYKLWTCYIVKLNLLIQFYLYLISDSSLTSIKTDIFNINIPSKRLKRPYAKSFYPSPTVVNGMNYFYPSSKNI